MSDDECGANTKNPTIADIEKAMEDASASAVELLPNGEVRVAESRDSLLATLATLRTENEKLRDFFEKMCHENWGYADFDGGDFHDYAMARGLLVHIPKDHENYEEDECTIGVAWKYPEVSEREG